MCRKDVDKKSMKQLSRFAASHAKVYELTQLKIPVSWIDLQSTAAETDKDMALNLNFVKLSFALADTS